MAQGGKEALVWLQGSIFCTFFWKSTQDGVCFLTLVRPDASWAGWILDLPDVLESNPSFLKTLAEPGNRYSV